MSYTLFLCIFALKVVTDLANNNSLIYKAEIYTLWRLNVAV